MKFKAFLIVQLLSILFLAACSNSSNLIETSSCGDGAVSEHEKCDGDASGDKTCLTEAQCQAKATNDSCKTATYDGSKQCKDVCSITEITTCVNDDGCCPSGCNYQNDNDCPSKNGSVCGDGKKDDDENCDPADANNPCLGKKSCENQTIDACLPYVYTPGYSICSSSCKKTDHKISYCANDDGCCPNNCKFKDNDCEVDLKNVGEPCTQDTDCGTEGHCHLVTEKDLFRNGYCTADCSLVKCPSGSVCTSVNNEMLCLKTCSGSCRDKHYSCDNNVCKPVQADCSQDSDCVSPQKCVQGPNETTKKCIEYGTGNGKIGSLCQRVSECEGSFDGECYLGPTSSNKICTQKCSTTCPNGSHCTNVSGGSFCFKDCNSIGDCTQGANLKCVPNQDNVKVCMSLPKNVGEECTKDSECGGGLCLTEERYQQPKGYCSKACAGSFVCPTGSYCTTISYEGRPNSLTVCLAECDSDSSCRQGYECLKPENKNYKVCVKK